MKTGDFWKKQERTLPTQKEMSDMAKEDYGKSNAKAKIETLERMNKIDKDLASLKALQDALADDRPVVFYSVGTTGLKADDELMQFAVGILNAPEQLPPFSAVYPVSMAAIERAEKNDGYDIFANGGFDRPVDKNGLGVSKAEYIKACKDSNGVSKSNATFFNYLKDSGFNGLSDMRAKGTVFVGLNPSFAAPFLESRNLAFLTDAVDILDVIKEYDYSHLDEAPLNMTDSRYSLEGIASQYDGLFNNGDGKLYSCLNKVMAMEFIANEITNREREKEEPVEVKQETAEEVRSRANELDDLLTKLVKSFTDVLVMTTKAIENNTRVMEELRGAIVKDDREDDLTNEEDELEK